MRLCKIGNDIGTLKNRLFDIFKRKKTLIDKEITRLNTIHIDATPLSQILRRPEMTYADLPIQDESLPVEVAKQVEIAIKYAGYIERQEQEVEKFRAMEDKQIPLWLNYATITGLRNEARQKLIRHQPATVGQASRISGISPSDISLVLVHLKRGPQKEMATD